MLQDFASDSDTISGMKRWPNRLKDDLTQSMQATVLEQFFNHPPLWQCRSYFPLTLPLECLIAMPAPSLVLPNSVAGYHHQGHTHTQTHTHTHTHRAYQQEMEAARAFCRPDGVITAAAS